MASSSSSLSVAVLAACNKFRDITIFSRSSGVTLLSSSPTFFSERFEISTESKTFYADTLLNHTIDACKCSAADKEDVCGIHLHEFLLGVFSAPFRGILATVPSMIFSSAC